MKRKITHLLLLLFFAVSVSAQNMVMFENFDDQRNINYWSSAGVYIQDVNNPHSVGNTSAKVGQYDRVANDEWQLLSTALKGSVDPGDWESYDLSQTNIFYMDVYSTTATEIQLTVKEEGGPNAGDLGEVKVYYLPSDAGTWKTLIFDFSHLKDHVADPAGRIEVLLFLGHGRQEAQTIYVDNFRGADVFPQETIPSGYTMLENFSTERNIHYWSSTGDYISQVSNPNPSGVNTSSIVGRYVRTEGESEAFQMFSTAVRAEPDPSFWSSYDLSQTNVFYIDVYSSVETDIKLTLKETAGAGSDIEGIERRYTSVGQWQTLIFDFSDYSTHTPTDKIEVLMFLGHGSWDPEIIFVDNFRASDGIIAGVNNSNSLALNFDQLYPNPGSDITFISYSINNSSAIALKIYNLLGVEIATLEEGFKSAGSYEGSYDVSSLAPGMYYYTLSAGDRMVSKTFIKQ